MLLALVWRQGPRDWRSGLKQRVGAAVVLVGGLVAVVVVLFSATDGVLG